MSAIILAVFKATIGLIVDKGRDVAAERMKEGDVTDQKFRSLIVRDLKEIHNKLDALSQKDLNAAVDFFETGLGCLYRAVDTMRSANVSLGAAQVSERNEEEDFKQITLPSDTDPEKTVLADGIRNMQLTELDETTKSLLSDAQENFRLAVENATHACNNEALSTFDRITAIRYRVMAAMLKSAAETVRTTGDLKSTLQKALPECEQCLKKLNSLPAVQNSFKVELSKGLLNIRGRFGKDERMQIISTVCQVNRTIYDAMRTVGKDVHVLVWPYVDIGEDQVDPLRDVRVLQMLEKSEKVDMEHYRITPGLSFDMPGIHCATNTVGQFLIAGERGETVHVFDKNGMFQFRFRPQTDDAKTKIQIRDLVTEDVSEKIYLLIGLYNEERWESSEVQVLNKTGDLQYKFPVTRESRLVVSGSKLVILGSREADVYDQNGEFDRSFEVFKSGRDKYLFDCTATYDGRIMITHRKRDYSDYWSHCVHVFTMEGQEIAKFKSGVGLNLDYMLFSPRSAGEHVVIAGYNSENGIITVEIYTVDGKLVRRILLRDESKLQFRAITVTIEGHIAVCYNGKVVVFKN